MIAAIIVVCVLLFALFLIAAVAGNRAQTRLVERERAGRKDDREVDAVAPPR